MLEGVSAMMPVALCEHISELPFICSQEYEKEKDGSRSGVYVPIKTKPLDELEFELPPSWSAEPKHKKVSMLSASRPVEIRNLGLPLPPRRD